MFSSSEKLPQENYKLKLEERNFYVLPANVATPAYSGHLATIQSFLIAPVIPIATPQR